MKPPDPIDLAETFADLARSLLAEPTLESTLEKITSMAVGSIDGCECAGISLIEKTKVGTVAASSDTPSLVDAIQYETGQGPCLDAIREREVFRTGDLATEHRWPDFSARAAQETGVLSMLAFRLFAEEDTMGALNLYATERDAFDDTAETIGAVFAAHAAVAMSNARQVENLEAALDSRGVIDQAKGIIMGASGCSAEEAFDLLRQQSQTLNEKLRSIAEDLVGQRQRLPHG